MMYDTRKLRKVGSASEVTSKGESERLTRARNASCAAACDRLVVSRLKTLEE